MTDEILFSKYDLRATLESTMKELALTVERWDPDAILTQAEDDIIEYLIERASGECPTLNRGAAALQPVDEVQQSIDRGYGQSYTRRMTRYVLVVPYDGERELFFCKPSSYTLSPPRADIGENEIRLTWIGDPTSGEEIKTRFDGELDKIEQWLRLTCADVDQHNREVAASAAGVVRRRKEKLLADRKIEAAIGYPVRQRQDAARYAVPVTRRRILAKSPAPPIPSTPFAPEPILADADYEAALAVLRNSRNALERSPSLTRTLNEEQIRDLLLVYLNAQFEGKAGGELFNGQGKTDILIREQDRNIFIGECKIWRGPSTIGVALDQLLGYLVWRDTKAALLLFIRSGTTSEIIDKSIAKIEDAPTYKRRGAHDTDERIDFILHAPGTARVRSDSLSYLSRSTTVRRGS